MEISRLIENVLAQMQKPASRQLGQTTVLAKLAKDKNAVIVCHDKQEEARVNWEYGVPTLSLEHISMAKAGMSSVPLIFDPMALQMVLVRALVEIDRKSSEIEKLRSKIKRIEAILEE